MSRELERIGAEVNDMNEPHAFSVELVQVIDIAIEAVGAFESGDESELAVTFRRDHVGRFSCEHRVAARDGLQDALEPVKRVGLGVAGLGT